MSEIHELEKEIVWLRGQLDGYDREIGMYTAQKADPTLMVLGIAAIGTAIGMLSLGLEFGGVFFLVGGFLLWIKKTKKEECDNEIYHTRHAVSNTREQIKKIEDQIQFLKEHEDE